MSRHRTTMKMHRASDKQGGSVPAEATSEATQDVEAGPDRAPADGPLDGSQVLTVETLGRYLAEEASRRKDSEEHTTTVLARYFKLTLVLAGLNMLVAGASVALLFSRSDRVQTVVVAPQALPTVPASSQPPKSAQVPLQPTEPLDSVPAPVAPLPAKIHLLGQPPSTPRPTSVAVATRTARAGSRPLPSKPMAIARSADDDAPEPGGRTERW